MAYIIIMSTNVTAVVKGAGCTDEHFGAPEDSVRRCVVAVMAMVVLPFALLREMVSSILPHVRLSSLLFCSELTLVSPGPLSIVFDTHHSSQLLPFV